jgi:hypothetical protein
MCFGPESQAAYNVPASHLYNCKQSFDSSSKNSSHQAHCRLLIFAISHSAIRKLLWEPIGKAEQAIGLIFAEGISQWSSELAWTRDRSSQRVVVEPWFQTTVQGPGVESKF